MNQRNENNPKQQILTPYECLPVNDTVIVCIDDGQWGRVVGTDEFGNAAYVGMFLPMEMAQDELTRMIE